ncbi:MAG: cobalamin-dependent protein [Polyangiaceae bacterium]|nr:cobalamin-dependent protein [Polyangiaceae bacterium]
MSVSVLLIRPDPGNERFGLGPFFRVEPLGLGYIAAALRQAGHEPHVVDARFESGLARVLRRTRPRVVGVSALHALEYERVLEVAREVRRLSPGCFVLVGGHAAAAFPEPLETDAVDAICLDDGEEVVPALVDALERGTPLAAVPALRLRTPDGWVTTAPLAERTGLDRVPLPERLGADRYRSRYHCLLFRPVWLVETARGCPFRCSFCSVWQLYGRSFRERSVGAVVDDFAAVGEHVFVADDLFWNHPARSLELAHALRRRGVRKRWILVQSRCDLVARHPELLAAWRPLAEHFDVFFGLEAPTDAGLAGLAKDASLDETLEGVRAARAERFGVTGNFLVDPAWGESEFRELWAFVKQHGLGRAGYTILTPLPGTELFERLRPALEGQPWANYDMHHLLWRPKLGPARFFELYAETWRRSVLNLSGDKRWLDWVRQVRPREIPYITRVMLRTQRLMKPRAYLAEHEHGAHATPLRSVDPAWLPAPARGSSEPDGASQAPRRALPLADASRD